MAWKLACILGTYITCNPTVKFWKYELNNKLFVGVTFFCVTLSVTWTKPNISKFIVNFDKSTVILHCIHIFFILTKFQGDQRLLTMSSINFLNLSFCSLE